MILYTHDLWPDLVQFRPTVGEQIRAGLTYREHQQSAHLWAYQFGDTSTVYVGANVTTTLWSDYLGPEPVDEEYVVAYQTMLATEATFEDGPGRPDLGAYRTGTFVDTTQTYEVRLRGSKVEARVMIGIDGETPVELLLGTYEDGSNTYPSRRFVRLDAGDTENVVAWVAQVRAPDADGFLEQVEVTPCRFGGDAPVDSTASPIVTVDTMPSGMDYPTLGGDVVVGARDPGSGDLFKPNPPVSTGSAIDPWPASELATDVTGYAATQWDAAVDALLLERLNGPSVHVAAAWNGSNVTYSPSIPGLALGDAWVMSIAVKPSSYSVVDTSRDLFRAGDIAIIMDEVVGGAQSFLVSEPPTGVTSAIGSWVAGQWYDITLAWVPSATVAGGADLYVWINGLIVYGNSLDDVAGGVLEIIGESFDERRLAWPVLMRRPRAELGTLSEILGYVESWLGWRGMMTGIF